MTRVGALFAMFFSVLSPAWAQERGISVFAAASLSGALQEVATTFAGDVRLSFGGSGTIARQVAAGAPADVVVLASPLWMEWLVQQGMLASASPVNVAGNALVLIGPANAEPIEDLSELSTRLGTGRLAMGQRDAVPAGIYARQWFEAEDLWDDIQTRLAETDSVRAALALVARGEAQLGVVYATDAEAENRVRVLWRIPKELHDPVIYPAAAVTAQGNAFLDHLTSPLVAGIFARHGFLPVRK